jgi:D-lactate dehydrogenase (cytochrome)
MTDLATPVARPELGPLTSRLGAILGDRVTDSLAARDHHSEDEGYHSGQRPDLVAFPRTTEEVAQVMAACHAAGVPVTTWGAGTSLEGNALAVCGGLCLDLSQMDQIVEIQAEDLTVTVQAGVRRKQLNQELRTTGLFFPIDPGADATLGGMAATRASGTNAVRYGTMRDNVVSCVAVTAAGQVIRTARRAPKSAAGYDLTALMVGSEGTLGIITELTVRLYPVPEHTAAAVCVFETLDQAVAAVQLAIQMGLEVAKIEFLDAPMMRAINRFDRTSHAEAPTLFLEFHGTEAGVRDQIERLEEIIAEYAGRIADWSLEAEKRSALWKARHNALYASKAMSPGAAVLITDVCVPISRLAECLSETRADLDRSGLQSTIAGHVGDGNFHAFILFDRARPEELAEAQALHHRMATRAIAMDGTCTGEHGIGQGKQQLLEAELGDAVGLMREIKRALDPQNLLNPGKIFAGGPAAH